MPTNNLAAIDTGTNSTRMLITSPDGKILYRDAISTRMGEGLSANNFFTPEAIKRGLDCFAKFAATMKEYEVKKYWAVATAACRMSNNGADFIKQIKEQTGINVDIISPLEEARLNLNGAILNTINRPYKYVIVFDIGGGSTEISLATNEPNAKILHTISIPLGARNSADKFSLVEYSEPNADNLRKEIQNYTKDFIQKSELDKYRGSLCVLATSSTALRLAHLCNGWSPYIREKGDNVVVSANSLDKVIKETYQTNLSQHEQNPCIGKNRAPIFIPACIIFEQIYKDLGATEIITSLKAAVEGMIMELKNAAN